jgi:glycosyltransferase involved in cell wall biosynthesis
VTSGPVAVVVPAFNAARFLGEALESVFAQGALVGQVVVVDDGSTDATGEVAASFPAATLIHRDNGGIGAARNTGVAAAEGELLAFLDADDVWPPGRLRALKHALESDPLADAAFGMAIEFGAGRPDGEPTFGQLASTMLIRRPAFDRVGPFREDVKVGEFVDWWARAEDLGLRHATVPDVVLRRRIHDTNTGIIQAGSRQDYVRVLRAALERRRGAS